jgi:hypothetical protein
METNRCRQLRSREWTGPLGKWNHSLDFSDDLVHTGLSIFDKDHDMKKIIFLMLVPFTLAACASPRQPTEARQQIKDACASGQYESCSEIGYIVYDENKAAGAWTP